MLFFFKHKPAYGMRISDWSSDVCSSDLLDTASYASWYAALIDLSLRLSGLGWRNALCETAFVARGGEGGPADGDLDALAARWPAWHARLANFLMHDPLGETREMLGRIERGIDAPLAQRDLFAAGHDAIVDAGEPHVTSREDGPDDGIAAPRAPGCGGGAETEGEAAARTEEG